MPIRTALPAVLATSLVTAIALAQPMPSAPPQPDPQMQAVLDALASMNPKPIETLSPEEARKQPTPAMAAMKVMKDKGVDPANMKEGIADVDDREISVKKADGSNQDIDVRVYTPDGDGPFPVVVYYHGGGFVIATVDTYDASCRALTNMADAVLVSVEYRKAPENKYPAAGDDAFAAYQWVREHAGEIKGNPSRVAVAGESAGGALATVVSMMAKEKSVPMPTFQLLIYPVTNDDMDTPSYQRNADAKPLNKATMAWFFKHYLADPKSSSDPHVSSMKATDEQLRGLPPAMVITAEIDPLMSEGKQYADRLRAAGVSVQYKHYDGVTHEFFGMGLVIDKAKEAEMDAANALKQAFAGGMQPSGNGQPTGAR